MNNEAEGTIDHGHVVRQRGRISWAIAEAMQVPLWRGMPGLGSNERHPVASKADCVCGGLVLHVRDMGRPLMPACAGERASPSRISREPFFQFQPSDYLPSLKCRVESTSLGRLSVVMIITLLDSQFS